MLQKIKEHHKSIIDANNKKRFDKFYKNSKINNFGKSIFEVKSPKLTVPRDNASHAEPSSSVTPNIVLFNMVQPQHALHVNTNVNSSSSLHAPSTVISSIIPLNIFQTWYTLDLPAKMKENVDRLKQENPEFTFYLYDDRMCRDFIQTHFDEDIVWAFDKLKPGAYKADLWRYCVLYIHGGVYLDIKMKSINKFKLIRLTEREYFPQDRFCDNTYGIWQGLLVCLPKNEVLRQSIKLVCQNVKNNLYGVSALAITGPHMICKFIDIADIQNSPIRFDIESNDTSSSLLYFNGELILRNYNEYRNDSIYSINKSHYSWLWDFNDVYIYPSLKSQHSVNFSNTTLPYISNNNTKLYSGTPTIIPSPTNINEYIINLRWINYNYNENGSKDVIPKRWISLNSRFTVDINFKKISNEIFLLNSREEETDIIAMGIEDIRVIKFNNKHFFLATGFHPVLHRPCVVSNEYMFDENTYSLNKTYIQPTFYNLNTTRIAEKNWAMFEYKSKLCVVYKWYPLQIGLINYDTHELNLIETNQNIPQCFQDARGSTIGCTFNDEIWFVLHKAQNNKKYVDNHYSNLSNSSRSAKICYNYQHFFAVFDLDMKLKKYSELFKFGDKMVEFCTGLIMEETRLILSYSLLDTTSCVSTYDYDTLHKSIKWYEH